MPYYKKKRKYNKKKKQIQRVTIVRPRRSRLSSNYTQNIGMPLTKKVKLTYVDLRSFASSGVSHAGYQYRMNSIYDCDLTGTGHQPYGRDQYSQFYNKYRVISSKITVKARQLPSATQPVVVGAFLDKDLTLPLALDTKIEQTKGRSTSVLNCNTNAKAYTSNYYNSKKWFPPNGLEYIDQSCLFSTNPTTGAVCEVWVQSMDGATAVTTSTQCIVTIDYWVELSDPIQFGGS